MKNLVLVINEQHTLLTGQERILKESGWRGETVKAPANGWNVDQMRDILCAQPNETELIFASPIGAMMSLAVRERVSFRVLHNDKREAKEIKNPDGSVRVIHAVAATGWQIV